MIDDFINEEETPKKSSATFFRCFLAVAVVLAVVMVVVIDPSLSSIGSRNHTDLRVVLGLKNEAWAAKDNEKPVSLGLVGFNGRVLSVSIDNRTVSVDINTLKATPSTLRPRIAGFPVKLSPDGKYSFSLPRQSGRTDEHNVPIAVVKDSTGNVVFGPGHHMSSALWGNNYCFAFLDLDDYSFKVVDLRTHNVVVVTSALLHDKALFF